MDINQKLVTEISRLNREIELKYPELYKHLGETPLTIPSNPDPEVNNKVLEKYLQSLKDMLAKHKLNH